MHEALWAERIVALRELHGWTQTQLAGTTGISQAYLSQIERLQRTPSPEIIEQIAESTGTPMSFFAAEALQSSDDTLHFRKNRTASQKLTRQFKRYFQESARAGELLVDRISYPKAALSFLSDGARVTPDALTELAGEARRAMGLSPADPIRNLTRGLERSGISVFRIDLADLEHERVVGSGHFGISHWAGPGTRAAIAYVSGSGDRNRFTLAHELGHLLLHTFRTNIPSQEAEKEAHAFASLLLLPRERAHDLVSPSTTLNDFARIKASFGISIQASVMNAELLGIIDEQRKRSLFRQISQRGWRTTEPVEVSLEEPQLLRKAREMGWPKAPLMKVADEVGLPAHILRAITLESPPQNSPSHDPSTVVDLNRYLDRREPVIPSPTSDRFAQH
ncbi:helix-turn-helix domain-containing protein [Nesterenkonia sp. CF4.4]|uniref:helix-turn-helix domain-containing protein n=1 Tax=Nesterenkonia sp. CF4.4 TaxID=3373079 RepID=UPI003EE52472